MSALKIAPTECGIGAEVRGLDLRAPLDDEERQTLKRVLAERAVRVFRDQRNGFQEQMNI